MQSNNDIHFSEFPHWNIQMNICIPTLRNASQQTGGNHTMLFNGWPNVFDAGPTLKQHWVNASCLLGWIIKAADCWTHCKQAEH